MYSSLPSLTIRDFTLKYPIIQGGMGVGISWDNLAGAVANFGCGGTVSSVGTGYWNLENPRLINGKPLKAANFHHTENYKAIIKSAIEKSGGGVIGVNILCALTDYARQVRDSVEAGARYIISGAGLPLRLPEYVGKSDIALIPIISSPRVIELICRRWKRQGRLPDAVILEGPKSGGHQGYTYDQCLQPEFQLENTVTDVVKKCKEWGNIPLIVAGGVWNRADIERFLDMGASGVQMATRFIGTEECDASRVFKQILINSSKDDIQLIKSPVGYPARGIVTSPLIQRVSAGYRPKIPCISNCVTPCNNGHESNIVGYCIADSLADAALGNIDTGLFFSGSNGYRLKEISTVKEVLETVIGMKPEQYEWDDDISIVSPSETSPAPVTRVAAAG